MLYFVRQKYCDTCITGQNIFKSVKLSVTFSHSFVNEIDKAQMNRTTERLHVETPH